VSAVRREQVFAGWGEPGAGPPFPARAAALLRSRLGVSGEIVARPVGLEDVRLRPPVVGAALRAALERAGTVRDDQAARVLRAGGKSYLDLLALRAGAAEDAPDVVVAPGDEAQVQAVLHACAEAGAAVIPFGGGTSVVGGVAPLRGRWETAVSLDLARLDAVLAVDAASRLARVQAGRRLPELDHALRAYGLRLGHAPQSYEWATVGGCAATRSAGQASTGVGRFEDLVAGLRCVTPLGTLEARAVPASAAGPPLRELVLGSEGRLGVISELTLRVVPLPTGERFEAWLVPGFAAGCELLRALAQAGAAPDVVRLSDEDETATTMALTGGRGMGRCLLICGWEGSAGRSRRVAAARALLRLRALPLGARPGRAWCAARFAAPHLRDGLLDRGVLVETLETATTWSRLAALHAGVARALHEALAATPPVVGCHVSHVYPDGASLYFTVLARQSSEDPAGQWYAAKRAATDAVMAGGGTLTHHHAIGTEHRPWLSAEDGELGVEVLSALAQRCDPAGIMNPGKLLPE
jgi:alkyldihydroxyacetonephosphate synthase